MKKYLISGMAAIMFCGVFTSCTRDHDYGAQTKQQQIQETYEEAFISRFGTPSPNQDWGFGPQQTISRARTRAEVTPTVSLIGKTFNATLTDMAGKLGDAIINKGSQENFSSYEKYQNFWNSGWNDNFYQINGAVTDSEYTEDYITQLRNIILNEIPEGQDNRSKATSTGYSVTTKGGKVTLTPIYHNSSSGDVISYYYYPANTTPTVEEIKAMKKYTIGNICDPEVCKGSDDNAHMSFDKKTYTLVYDDGAGNISETFPEGYKINFIVSNSDLSNGNLTIYQGGGYNESAEQTEEQSEETDDTPSALVPGKQLANYSVPANKTYFCGEYAEGHPWAQFFVRMGNGGQADDRRVKNEQYNDFGASGSDPIEGYDYYSPGNGENGDLTQLGTTVYYFRYIYYNSDGLNRSEDEFMARVGIKLNANKKLYVVELDDKNDTSGKIVEGFNGKTYSEQFKGIIEFRIKHSKTYAIYATGSKLGFYGCEVLYENSKRSGARSATRGYLPVTTTTIPNEPEFYGDGRLNKEIHNTQIDVVRWKSDCVRQDADEETSHIAVFSIGGKNYIGFEDWLDFDYNDVIFEVTNTEGGTEIVEETDEWDDIRVIAEDLSVGQNTDFDFNDIVYDVRRYKKDTQTKHKNGEVEIILRAAGGTLPLYILQYDEDHEVHNLFNVDQYTMVNTKAAELGLKGKDDAEPVVIKVTSEQLTALGINSLTDDIGKIAKTIPVWVFKKVENPDSPILLDAPDPAVGIASKFGVKITNDGYQWCDEREDIDHRYSIQEDGTSLFKDWVQGFYPNNDWFKYANRSIEEYRAAKAAANAQGN